MLQELIDNNTIHITEKALFGKKEFKDLSEGECWKKAIEMGWRYNSSLDKFYKEPDKSIAKEEEFSITITWYEKYEGDVKISAKSIEEATAIAEKNMEYLIREVRDRDAARYICDEEIPEDICEKQYAV